MQKTVVWISWLHTVNAAIDDFAVTKPRHVLRSWETGFLIKSVLGFIFNGFTTFSHRQSDRNNIPGHFDYRAWSFYFTNHFKASIFAEILWYLPQTRVLSAKRNVCCTGSGVEFCRFVEALGAVFSGFCYPGNKLENWWTFGGVTDLEWGRCRGWITTSFSLVNSLTADGWIMADSWKHDR